MTESIRARQARGLGIVETRLFVQFPHPGGEHGPDLGWLRSWNTGSHRRKFLVVQGRVEESDRVEPLVLWGEWEPPSDVLPISDPKPDGPRFLHKPFWKRLRTYQGLQNTDPFVFDGFYYSICRQSSSPQLRWLQRGSVLLFGSQVAGGFVLDTVLVVRDFVDHSAQNYLAVLDGVVPADYLTVSLRPFYESNGTDDSGCGNATSLRLYIGATADKPVAGMYSFFPCQGHRDGTLGFARPRISLPDVINPASAQAPRLNRGLRPERFPELWGEIRKQVLAQGCQIGTWAAFPPRRD